jgi:hypothetical protein
MRRECIRWCSLLALVPYAISCGGRGRDAQQRVELPLTCTDEALAAGSVVITGQSDLDRLAGCESVSGDLTIMPFPEADLRPLGRLEEVRGTFTLGDPYVEADPPLAFPSLAGLESLAGVGTLVLNGVLASSLEPFRGLRRFIYGLPPSEPGVGTLSIAHAANLVDLSGLENLEIAGALYFKSNPRLRSLAHLRLPAEMTEVTVEDCPVEDLSAFSAVDSVRSLRLIRTGLKDLGALAGLRTGDVLLLLNNPELVDATGLSSLQEVTSFDVHDNPVLTLLPEVASVRRLGSMSIAGNATLSLGPRFPALRFAESISIDGNARLQAVTGLASLRSVRTLEIRDNPSLEELDLSTLQTIDQSLYIAHNERLSAADLVPALANPPSAMKIAANLDQPTLLDPCPWSTDEVCDAAPLDSLCAPGTDPMCSAFE